MIPIYGISEQSYSIIGEMNSNEEDDDTTKTKRKLSIKRKTKKRTQNNKPHGKPVPMEDNLGVKPPTKDEMKYSELDDHTETDING